MFSALFTAPTPNTVRSFCVQCTISLSRPPSAATFDPTTSNNPLPLTLHDAVGVNCKKDATTDIKDEVPGIWAKGCMFDNSAFIIRLDMSTPR